MKYILLLAGIFALAFASPAARPETSSSYNSEVKATPEDVPGATIEEENTARAKAGYVFAQESRKSIAVIKVGGRSPARFQTGSLICVSPDNSTCDAFLGGDKTVAACKGVHRGCHFVGVCGGVRAP
jgi:hypothetical protein